MLEKDEDDIIKSRKNKKNIEMILNYPLKIEK